MSENEIITQEDPQMQLFSQLMEGILKKLERYCATARPMLGGEVYLTGEEVCSQLRLSTRTLQEYRNLGTLPFYKIGGKILYKQSNRRIIIQIIRYSSINCGNIEKIHCNKYSRFSIITFINTKFWE